ncbi:general secretion pathway protein H [Pseudidiomarina indica]|uniref:Type II secretion system protein H n=1 Tax=Pseudidiomarina indica TaxID=1159017 RepID=A0A1G6BG62_9GAMM|nr:GspH/FimT family pseudopilin [Pseudidiomarina indica]SDB19630.1 general secretion pathway protein H [Pseudidiomarina indica]
MLRRWQGFTLVEVMVTIAVIAMLALTVSFVVPSRQQDTTAEAAHTLYERLRYARDYALLRHAVIGLRIDNGDHYRFLEFTEGRWQNLQHRALPPTTVEGLDLMIATDDLALLAQDGTRVEDVFGEEEKDYGVRRDSDEDPREPPPQLMILGSGELPLFELVLRHFDRLGDSHSWRIASDDGLHLTLERID